MTARRYGLLGTGTDDVDMDDPANFQEWLNHTDQVAQAAGNTANALTGSGRDGGGSAPRATAEAAAVPQQSASMSHPSQAAGKTAPTSAVSAVKDKSTDQLCGRVLGQH